MKLPLLAATLALAAIPVSAKEHLLAREVPVAVSACVNHQAAPGGVTSALEAHGFTKLGENLIGKGKAAFVHLTTKNGKHQCDIVGVNATEQQMDLLAQPWIRGGDAKTTDPFGPLMNKAWKNSTDGKTHFLLGITPQQDIAGFKGSAIVVRAD